MTGDDVSAGLNENKGVLSGGGKCFRGRPLFLTRGVTGSGLLGCFKKVFFTFAIDPDKLSHSSERRCRMLSLLADMFEVL